MRVSVILSAIGTLVAAVSDVTYPASKVSSFNLNALNANAKHELLQALEHHGIVAFQDIPNFPTLRRNYLQTAAECANKAKDLDLLMHKELVDGTQRKTFSINMNGLDKSIVDRCPEYAAAHDQYTKMVDGVTKTFAAVMDDINPDFSSQLLSPVVENGKHLDHFHAYSKPADVDPKKASAQLSLDIHADAGLAIVFPKANYFANVDGKLVEVTDPFETGLVIDIDGQLVKPDLEDDKLYLMAGEGLQSWANWGHQFRPLPHGMVMPNDIDASIVRAFVGRMLLLQGDMKMANTGLRFDEYTNATTRYLKAESGYDSVMSLACPPGRILKASDSSCTLAIWVPDEGSTATNEDCMRQCNIWGHPEEREKCEKELKCKNTGEEIPDGGNDCWMMCIAHLTPEQCPAPGIETCDSKNRVLDCVGLDMPTDEPTDTPSDDEPSDDEPSDDEPSNDDPKDDEPSDEEPSDDVPVDEDDAVDFNLV
ncbi:Aste57867_15395 [Aphanomyces stellatus]|uniref:Aste57867_15395 protein n=1 Tax=Aphanomyces stellatus TaxID=120398 RepID=A0A485L4D7_9STRA|nr:hypothetical protein As57867_015339 [Aphanomyces stellatus]VFT92199.1 Aste57867_15395 [Aphanomyces stellatus]